MTITTIGVIMLFYSAFIRPFTTKTETNDTRTDNAVLYGLSLIVIVAGLVLGI
jgi:hypothetical protein